MKKVTFYIVDVFAEAPFQGNQLGVFVDLEDQMDHDQMLMAARELNFAESTFIKKVEGGKVWLRIFTPGREIPFAGHPTLGTAFIANNFLLDKPMRSIILEEKVGPIPVEIKGDIEYWMTQNQPRFYPTPFGIEDVALLLGLEIPDISYQFPISKVSTGLPFLIVPINNLEANQRIHLNIQAYRALMKPDSQPEGELPVTGILTFTEETYNPENDLNVRMFAPYVNVPEDPATGSANGCLLAYLLHLQALGSNKLHLRVEQGYEIGRPSLLVLDGSKTDSKYKIRVGGKIQLIAEGSWYL